MRRRRLPLVEGGRWGRSAAGLGATTGYSFKIGFSTCEINGETGDLRPFTVPADDLVLDPTQAEALVAYCKQALKQPWEPNPVNNHLRRAGWCDLILP